MKIEEVQERTPEWIRQLTAVWEASVRATHTFLSDAEIERIRAYVPQALGRLLLEYGVAHYGVRELTVNEQNPQAVGFYRHMGFETYMRTETDEQGGPYPLLYMRRV